MTIRHRRSTVFVLAMLCSTVLVVSGCSAPETRGTDDRTANTEPTPGGSMQAIQGGEPRSLDPATMVNAWMAQSLVGNALYGTLMTNDVETFEVGHALATGFVSEDGGATFTLTLRPDLVFTDGTLLDAAAVEHNWDRLRDPKVGSPSLTQAAQVTSTEVVDPLTLRVVMAAPNPHFAQSLVTSGMNWIASPDALQKGQSEFDKNPIGAGPFRLASWSRQNRIELTRNPDYWDQPKPYLDALTIRTVPDTNQRLNAITTGSADLAMEASWFTLSKAEAAGYPTYTVPTGGGQFLAFNTRKAPFDDVRARRAVSLALDLEEIDAAVYNSTGSIPETLFPEVSPFHKDMALHEKDRDAAKRLFDELAAEGNPVDFTFLAYSSIENKAVAEAVQAQLSAFENVTARIEIVEFVAGVPRLAAGDFDMAILSATILDPDASLWSVFHSDSRGNYTGIDDEELDKALDVGRVAKSTEERVAAYEVVQQRLADLDPAVWYVRSAPSVVTGKDTYGVATYGMGSVLPEELWTTEQESK